MRLRRGDFLSCRVGWLFWGLRPPKGNKRCGCAAGICCWLFWGYPPPPLLSLSKVQVSRDDGKLVLGTRLRATAAISLLNHFNPVNPVNPFNLYPSSSFSAR